MKIGSLLACLAMLMTTLVETATAQNKLQGTEEEALVEVLFTNFEDVPKAGETILFRGKENGKEIKAVTDRSGNLQALVPEGDVYLIVYLDGTKEVEYSNLEVVAKEGIQTARLKMKFEPAKSWTLENVLFDTGKATLRPESFEELDVLVDVLKHKSNLEIEIAGHTDNVGNPEANKKLSLARSQAVVNYLIQKGTNPERLVAKGYGDTRPIAHNDTEEGRQLNRRTEVVVLKE